MADIVSGDEIMSHMRRVCSLDRMRYSVARAATIVYHTAEYALYIDLCDAISADTTDALGCAVDLVEAAGARMQERGELTPGICAQIDLVQGLYLRCVEHGRDQTHTAMMQAFRERGLHAMHRPAEIPPPPEAALCFVCADAPPAGAVRCCAQSSDVCDACYDRSGACPFCRAAP
jgi:hypothetical protein